MKEKLQKRNPEHNLNITIGDIELDDVEKMICELKNIKATGLYNIFLRCLKLHQLESQNFWSKLLFIIFLKYETVANE